MTELTGGCACGAVRYRIDGEPLSAFHCQCRQCQRASGTGHASLLVVPTAAVQLTGTLKFFTQSADDGSLVERGFCPECGSPVMGHTSGKPDLRLFTAASLDEPARFQPRRRVWQTSAQPWDFIDPALPTHATQAPG